MKQEALDRMKKLNAFARAAEDFWPAYDKRVSDPKCDKYEAQFNGDSRFRVFGLKAPVQFNALTGYYGSSGCSTFGSLDDELANKYFWKALNTFKREIFGEMAKRAKADAAQLAGDAAKELKLLQEMVEAAEKAA